MTKQISRALDIDQQQDDSKSLETLAAGDKIGLDDQLAVEMSAPFVSSWSRLISTTNWEKGKIISQWRNAMIAAEAPSSAYSDEAWSNRVGGVTAQHVGRLRRVHDRFHVSYESFAGLYWSHFLAALDWDDAELWLEGATRSAWSVSQMRRTRWESMGGDPAAEPRDSEIVAASVDEDYTPLAEANDATGVQDGPRSIAEGPRPDGPDFGDEDPSSPAPENFSGDDSLAWEDTTPAESPFAALPSLPVDFAEAVEQFKLAIIRHRAAGWSEVSPSDVLKALEALKTFSQQ